MSSSEKCFAVVMPETSTRISPLRRSKRGKGNENNEKSVPSIRLSSREITKGKSLQCMSSYSVSYRNGNSSSTSCSLNEDLSRNNISSSEQLEARKIVVDDHVIRLDDADNALSLSFPNDCNMHDNRDMSVDIVNFSIAESSASDLPHNSAEANGTNESDTSESDSSASDLYVNSAVATAINASDTSGSGSESSVDHQTNSISSSVLDGIESICQLCTPMSVASEYHLTRSSANNVFNPYSLENERVCMCDMKFTDYRQCVVCNFEGKKCDRHRYIKCTNCDEIFHLWCIGWRANESIPNTIVAKWNDSCICSMVREGSNPWLCCKCWCIKKKVSFNYSMNGIDWDRTARCVGIKRKLNERPERFASRVMKTIHELGKLVSEDVLINILTYKLHQYPTIVPMDHKTVSRHVFFGRRFEISMLMFDVCGCSCCGHVEPYHCDPNYNIHARVEPIKRRHFTQRWFFAWHCTCREVCGGSQFYSNTRPNHLKWYKETHRMDPWQKLGISEDAPNAVLCKSCHHEKVSKDSMLRWKCKMELLDHLTFYTIDEVH